MQSGVIGILIGLACVALLLKQVDLKQSWNALGRLNGPLLLIPVAVFLLNLPLRAWRWCLIFPQSARPAFSSCFTVLGIGNMANFLLPGRAGDLGHQIRPASRRKCGSFGVRPIAGISTSRRLRSVSS